MFQGLSTDQAPPISVPFRFFVTAPIFAILIAVVMIIFPSDVIFNRYTNIAVALTHLFTLGVLSMVIVGALQQMLPVLAGAVIKKPLLFSNVVHTNLTAGTLILSGGFIFSSSLMLSIGAAMLTLAFGVFFFVVIKLLFKVKYVTSTVNAMKIFSIAGAITILLGLHLAGGHISSNILSSHYTLVDIHVLFGIFGFAFIIIMGVAFQVIPMFYVAQDFPKYIQNKFPRIVFGMLIVYAVFTFVKLEKDIIITILEVMAIIFAVYGIKSLNNRRRPVFDVTLWYWKLSLGSLIVSMIIFMYGLNDTLGIMAIALGFIFSLLQGMIYKIVPFLSWFHLSSKGHFDIPTLRDFIKEEDIKIQFFIYIASLLFFAISAFLGQIFLYIASGLFIMSNILFFVNMTVAMRNYAKISKTDPMAAFK